MAKNLVLIGYRGAGKSTLAKKISRKVPLQLVSTDQELVRQFGKSISDFVKENGWESFRKEEKKVVEDFSQKEDLLVDTGGGVVEDPENVRLLRESGIVFYLEADALTLSRRIEITGGRPSLTGTASAADEVAQVLAHRDPLYRAAAHHVIDVRETNFFKAVDEMVDIYQREK
ncbi:MAG: shikimate kinase [Spirochaetia bacterium]|nr:shikimate kinase [Spirochaetia bacterium]